MGSEEEKDGRKAKQEVKKEEDSPKGEKVLVKSEESNPLALSQ